MPRLLNASIKSLETLTPRLAMVTVQEQREFIFLKLVDLAFPFDLFNRAARLIMGKINAGVFGAEVNRNRADNEFFGHGIS